MQTCDMLQCNKMCDILHKRVINPLKDTYMFKFEEQYKKFEEVLDRTQATYEFWTKAMFTTIKDIFNTSKTK